MENKAIWGTYADSPKLAPLVREIIWSHYSISPAQPDSYKNILPDAKIIAKKLQVFNLNSEDEEEGDNG